MVCNPVAIVQWPADSKYTGIYRHYGDDYISAHRAYAKYRLQRGVLSALRRANKVRYVKVTRPGMPGYAYLNREGDLAAAAAEYHLDQAERYRRAERQQAPNGDWYLSPGAFSQFVGVAATTRDNWRETGVPILGGEALDLRDFRDGNKKLRPYYSEKQAERIVESRAGGNDGLVPIAAAAKACQVDARFVRSLAKKGVLYAELRSMQIGGKTSRAYRIRTEDLRAELMRRRTKAKNCTFADPIIVAKAAKICRVDPGTVRRWIASGKIAHDNIACGERNGAGRRFVVSRQEALAFAALQAQASKAGGEEEWLYRRQIFIQFPRLPLHALRYYRLHAVPTLGRAVRCRTMDRPPGIKCPHKHIRQFLVADVRALAEWLQTRGTAPKEKVEAARAGLKRMLSAGPVQSREMLERLRQEGLGMESRAVLAARAALKIKIRYGHGNVDGPARIPWWCLPGQVPPSSLPYRRGLKPIVEFVLDELADYEPHDVGEMIARAAEKGISKRNLYVALPYCHVIKEREPGKRGTWRLAKATVPASPEPAEREEIAERRRGRTISAKTLELGKFCYDHLAAKTYKRRKICALVLAQFGRALAEPDVTTYARRYASAECKSWPI